MYTIKAIYLLVIGISTLVLSCKNIPRKPLNEKPKTFFKSSVSRNQNIVKQEQLLFKKVIRKDSTKKYFPSEKGFWYTYLKPNPRGKKIEDGQEVSFAYEISTLKGEILYSKEELQTQSYLVNKQEILPALREGILVMREKEVVSFIFPSYLCFRYQGDGKKIGINQPLRITITLI